MSLAPKCKGCGYCLCRCPKPAKDTMDILPRNTFELSDEEIEGSSHGFLKEAYKLLREHHILETRELWDRVKKARRALNGGDD